MRVAVLSPVWFPVPPTGYGGIEWVVSLLADGLVDAGHDVTLFASGDSQTKARARRPSSPRRRASGSASTFWELHHALALLRARRTSSTSSTTTPGLLGARARRRSARRPLVHTVHGPLDGRARRALRADRRASAPRVGLDLALDEPAQAASRTCRGSRTARTRSTSPSTRVTPHRGDYLLFLGRMSPDKGAHRAVDVALEAGLPLKIAGKNARARRAASTSTRSSRRT